MVNPMSNVKVADGHHEGHRIFLLILPSPNILFREVSLQKVICFFPIAKSYFNGHSRTFDYLSSYVLKLFGLCLCAHIFLLSPSPMNVYSDAFN